MGICGVGPDQPILGPFHCSIDVLEHATGPDCLKHAGFERAVNVTLGLPLIRTSPDHGTAFDLAGTGRADAGSLAAALQLAIRLATSRH